MTRPIEYAIGIVGGLALSLFVVYPVLTLVTGRVAKGTAIDAGAVRAAPAVLSPVPAAFQRPVHAAGPVETCEEPRQVPLATSQRPAPETELSRARIAPGGPGERGLLDAIRRVESGGDDRALGDYRKGVPLARGPYQIHRVWWIDSGGDPTTYLRDVWDANVCRVRILALWRKRCPAALAAGDLETLARTFRRPTKPWHGDNAAYWRKVKGEMR